MACTVGEGWRHQIGRRFARDFGDLLKMRAKRDSLLVRLGQPEVMLRKSRQCFLEGSKKSATFPMAALT